MRLRAFSSIGGLKLIGRDRTNRDVLELAVDKQDLSPLAIAFIQEANMDASSELIDKCRELVEAVDKDLNAADPDRPALIRFAELHFGLSKHERETYNEYAERCDDVCGIEFRAKRANKDN